MASSYDYDFDAHDHEDSIDLQRATSFHLYNVDDSDEEEEYGVYKSQSEEHDESGDSSFCFEDDEEQYDAKPPPSRGRQEQASQPQTTTTQSNNNPLSFSIMRKDKNLIERAKIRHRRRRYDLFSNLLVSASDLLLLDKSHAKAFIPMLRSLLSPPKRESPQEPNLKRSEKMGGWLRRATTMTLPTSSSMDEQSSHGYKSDPGGVLEQSEVCSDETEEVPHVTTNDFDDVDRYFLLQDLNDSDILKAFLESLSPGAGFRCLSLMLLQHLLRSEQGYDARVRHVFKKLGVIILVHEMEREQYSFGPDGEKIQLLTNSELAQLATRKFEALEHGIAAKLIQLSEMQQKGGRGTRKAKASTSDGSKRELRRGLSREQLVRGLKVGSAGIVAGTLFAVTGGLAAPGIAAGIAALAGGAAATAAVVTLTSTAAVTAIFGVGGGGLAAYKMQRRTQGLTEFKFQKESQSRRRRIQGGLGETTRIEPELFSTICISGWLRDYCDFQRPWGVSPSNPPIIDRLELLERFYSVHNPDHVSRCSKILSKWKNEENSLWRLLKKKYGRDPDELFPIEEGIRQRGSLTLEEDEVLDQLFVELGHISFLDEEASSMWKSSFRSRQNTINEDSPPRRSNMFRRQARSTSLEDSLRGSRQGSVAGENVSDADSDLISSFGNSATGGAKSNKNEQKEKERSSPKHLLTVWDYQAHYGGELYTIKWESRLLMELCDSVTDMAVDILENATRQILKTTALSTLLTAVAVPTVMLQAMNVIDGTWTMAIERSDEAGKELAKSLLFSRAGHRPVTLVGFSMGARVIYSCLKELAKYQEKWEDAREAQPQPAITGRRTKMKESIDKQRADDNITVFEGMREPASIVEDAIIMGLPNHMNLTSWEACRQIVGGRVINCYSRKDLILSLMFQSKKITSGLKKVCGTCAIDVPGVENYDVTDIVNGHLDYCFAAGDILKRVRHGQPIRKKQDSEAQAVGSEATEAI